MKEFLLVMKELILLEIKESLFVNSSSSVNFMMADTIKHTGRSV